jgi:hypothetical protein
MKSVRALGRVRAGSPLLADEVLEFHAARLLLLIRFCGTKNTIDGLTKLAKLDFFVRYPELLDAIAGERHEPRRPIEAAMVRHHYGPWDRRYYHVLGFLEGCGLIYVDPGVGRGFRFQLSPKGLERTARLATLPSYAPVVADMQRAKLLLGAKSGNAIKKLIYRTFDREVASLPLGKMIRP